MSIIWKLLKMITIGKSCQLPGRHLESSAQLNCPSPHSSSPPLGRSPPPSSTGSTASPPPPSCIGSPVFPIGSSPLLWPSRPSWLLHPQTKTNVWKDFIIIWSIDYHHQLIILLLNIIKPCLQSQQPTPRHFSGTARLHLNHPGFPFPSLKQTHLIHLNHPPPPSPHSEMDKSSQPHLGKGKSAPWSKPTNFWHQLSWQHFRLLPNSQQNSEKWHKFDFREPFIINLLNWAPASVGLYKFYRTISTLLPLEWIRYTKSNFFNFHSAQHQRHASHIGSLFNATQEIAC